MGVAAQWAGGILNIDLQAIAENYRTLCQTIRQPDALSASHPLCAAAVKADAYGLDASLVAPVLEDAGCRHFFVAHLAEGVALKPSVKNPESLIFVLHGPPPGTARDLLEAGLVPVINSMEQLTEWRALSHELERRLPAVLQVDSGMARFGMNADEVSKIAADPTLLDGIETVLVMSHLACADTPEVRSNRAQLEEFQRLSALLPKVPRSLAASSGIFLGPDWHFDLVRPGAALYGVNPTPGKPNPVKPVIRLQARVIQTRSIPEGQAVGYGGYFIAPRPSRIALLGIGYGDGFLRSISGRGTAILPSQPDIPLPVIGRVSMDSLAVDVTDLPEGSVRSGDLIDLIGPHNTLDAAATAAGTIGYEFLTDLGRRYHRTYTRNE
ncbi:alanine racemase [Acetobacter sp. UBA5411]|uniref:alanine racemase n=1 Tax=Acetobacter sp. UBA5411 TaxID=1945905 RepID=UPI0025BF3514|nr:alanine racemase [Acetobacter sp. UBA5411]